MLRRSGPPDLFVVQTLTFPTLYVIFFVSHGSRQLVHFEVTAHPSAAWVWRQLIEATPWDRKPRYLIHDHDRVWGADFGQRASGLAIKSLRTPIQAPRANSIAERWVGTARRECLDHLIPISECHRRRVLAEFVDYYNHDRPHRSLGLQAPFPKPSATHGRIAVRPVLGGLHHVYERAA
jgi:transposase InsO family protein